MKQRKRNIKLTIAYDGGRYHGFQRQRNVTAVQNILEDKLGIIFGDSIEMAASGRTDAGVHALAQVFHFDLPWKHGAARLQAALRVKRRPDRAAQP